MTTQVVNNTSALQNDLAIASGDFKTITDVSGIVSSIKNTTNALRGYNVDLQKHLQSEQYNILDQNALMDFGTTEHNRLKSRIEKLKNGAMYNNRVNLFNRSANSRLKVYTKLMIYTLLFILVSIGLYTLRNMNIISGSLLSVFIGILVFVIFLYYFIVLSDLSRRDKHNFDKYNWNIPKSMNKKIEVSDEAVESPTEIAGDFSLCKGIENTTATGTETEPSAVDSFTNFNQEYSKYV